MKFPLAPPPENVQTAMVKSWERVDLDRYLTRWDRSTVPPLPEALTAFDWRGLDIGCGFGRYLLRESERFPERGYLGIDKGTLRGGHMLRRFAAADRPNLFGIHGNVTPVLAAFPDALFDEITIFYPNPWWPAKHRKKRWSFHPLLPKMVRLLKPGGRLILTSNEAFYLSEWQWALKHHPEVKDLLVPDYAGPICESEGRTHFEAKFLAEQTPCGEIRVKRAEF